MKTTRLIIAAPFCALGALLIATGGFIINGKEGWKKGLSIYE
jgi:hypothetical protein